MTFAEPLVRFNLPGEGQVMALEGLGPEWVAAALQAHRENTDASRTLKSNLGTLVTQISTSDLPVPRLTGVPSQIVVKEVPRKSGIFGLARWLRLRSQFCRDFTVSRRLARLGVRSPRALASTFKSRGATEFLLSELVNGAIPLRDLLWLGEKVVRDPRGRTRLFESIGVWLRNLHEKGVWQRDMKPSNVLVKGDELVLVDITAVRLFRRPLRQERRQRNIAQLLDLSPDWDGEARLPLLRAYLGASLKSESTTKRWAAQVDQLIEARRDYRQSRCGFRFVDEEHFRRPRETLPHAHPDS